MASVSKAALSILACGVLTTAVITGIGHADPFDFDAIEIQADGPEALITMDAPPGGVVEPEDDPQRGQLTVSFKGASIRLPRRVYSGEGQLRSVDLEPWFADGERLTRLVVKYEPGASAWFDREGDIILVSIEGGEELVVDASEALAADEASTIEDDAMATATVDEEPATPAIDPPAVDRDALASEAAAGLPPITAPPAGTLSEFVTRQAKAPAAEVETLTEEELRAFEEAQEKQAEEARALQADLEADAAAAAAEAEALAAEASTTTPVAATTLPTTLPGTPADAAPEVPADPAQTGSQPATATTLTTPGGASIIPMESSVVAAEAVRPEVSFVPGMPTASWETSEAARGYGSGAAVEARELQGQTFSRIGTDLAPGVPRDEIPRITIDLQGADIHTVLRSIAETSGRNIVTNAGVNGMVNLRLVDVPWDEALTVILRTQGLSYVEDLGVIRVAQVSALNEEEISREAAERKKDGLVPLQTSVVPVRFAAAEELQLSVESILSPRGKIDVDKRTNSLVVTDIPSTLPVVQGLVTELDTKTPQVEIVAQLVDLDTSVSREIGIDWSLDNLHSTQYGTSGAVGVTGGVASPAGTVNLGVIKEFGDLDLLLQALEQSQKANIISNPKITTVNNREANILVGQEIPLIVQDEAGNPITELKKIGITLRVTPYINQDGLITLDLHPEVSDLASQSSTAGVIINTSEADTRVMVMDGETAVIGGLIRQNETEVESRVPVLGSIPLVGNLFKSKTSAKAKRELVIFVTPRIIQ